MMLTCEEKSEAWSQFLEYAEERCSATAFENWLAPIQVLQASEDKLTLEVPNIFVKEYLLENYQKDLLAFLPLNACGELALDFVIAAPKKQPKQETFEEGHW